MTQLLRVTVRTPVRLVPRHRDELIADPVALLLESVSPDSHLAVKETIVTPEGEPVETVLELGVDFADAEKVIASILDLEAGLPKGSTVEVNGKAATFGELEGLAVYLNGTDLPDATYETANLQALVDDLQEHVAEGGRMWSYWVGPAETALYFYGPDASLLTELVAERAHRWPLMERARYVPLVPPVES